MRTRVSRRQWPTNSAVRPSAHTSSTKTAWTMPCSRSIVSCGGSWLPSLQPHWAFLTLPLSLPDVGKYGGELCYSNIPSIGGITTPTTISMICWIIWTTNSLNKILCSYWLQFGSMMSNTNPLVQTTSRKVRNWPKNSYKTCPKSNQIRLNSWKRR